jgi:hypothetical protein
MTTLNERQQAILKAEKRERQMGGCAASPWGCDNAYRHWAHLRVAARQASGSARK